MQDAPFLERSELPTAQAKSATSVLSSRMCTSMCASVYLCLCLIERAYGRQRKMPEFQRHHLAEELQCRSARTECRICPDFGCVKRPACQLRIRRKRASRRIIIVEFFLPPTFASLPAQPEAAAYRIPWGATHRGTFPVLKVCSSTPPTTPFFGFDAPRVESSSILDQRSLTARPPQLSSLHHRPTLFSRL